MLKNIRLHIEKDEHKQAQLDRQLAATILSTHSENINLFQRIIPSLLNEVQSPDLQNYSLFINKHGETNIVDYGQGRTFYGFHPQQEVQQQIESFQTHCPQVSLVHEPQGSVKEPEKNEPAKTIQDIEQVKIKLKQSGLPQEVECLVILGCGLGLHLQGLLEQHTIKNVIVYEPELQYFQCSVMATSWKHIFRLCKEKDTNIFLQLEKDGRDLVDDINELRNQTAISSFSIYKHYNHQVFNSLYANVCSRSWQDIEENGLSIHSKADYLDYIPHWTTELDLNQYTLASSASDLYTNNLKAFEKYFPDIYQQYKNYTPTKWRPITDSKNEINLLKTEGLYSWYGQSPKQDCILNFNNFNEQPNKDGLVLGYNGTKLAHYIHYQFVKETEELLKQSEEEVGALPDDVPSIIMFGLGVGYQLEQLLEEHRVEKLFVCEPNPDFFYGSLFAIDWQKIFETVEQSSSRIYLNIGDDGTNLFRDLLSQFYAIGPYILNSTYFYQSYYNASLNSAISQLREQLQVVISMGEYFDHAYYGIAHTKEGMTRQYPLLRSQPAKKMDYDDKEVPIFIVGNGPSLDSSIEAIKEWQGQAIVVSCGTALQVMYQHGIVPDFHAEIEQNRCTYDWAILVGDLAYLKKITLITCNGIHPDTGDLYKEVLVAFKEGESSTISSLNILGRENFEVLQNAFPTVSNFVCDLFSTLSFTSIYLIGVDLGFVDVKHHHSKDSGYYQNNGKETYDYAKSANTSLMVPGNFRPNVNTKHEFKVSRQIIEQVTSGKPQEQSFYNCSDGARIKGTLPIRIDNLLIVATSTQKQIVMAKLKTKIFSDDHLEGYIERFAKVFSEDVLVDEVRQFKTLVSKNIASAEQANHLINKQKEMLFASYQKGNSLLFYFLYGTVNYVNAVLTKSLHAQKSTGFSLDIFNRVRKKWARTLQDINTSIQSTTFDTSSYRVVSRELLSLQLHATKERVLVVTDSCEFRDSILAVIAFRHDWLTPCDILTPEESEHYPHKPTYSIYYVSQESSHIIQGVRSTLVLADTPNRLELDNENLTSISILKEKKTQNHFLIMAYMTLKVSQSEYQCAMIIPKSASTGKATKYRKHITHANQLEYVAYSYPRYVCLYLRDRKKDQTLLCRDGSRGKKIMGKLQMKHLVY
jgi:L-rhamnose mutarotase